MLDATLAIADERGLPGVTMRAVAQRLAVSPMALYHYVRDKHDLLDGLLERLLAEIPLPDGDLPGEERLHSMAANMREAAVRHPGSFALLLGRPVATEAALEVREAAYAALRDAGVPTTLVPRIERLISTFVIGFAASEAGGRFAAHDQSVRDADFEWGWQHMLALATRPAGEVVAAGS